MIKAPLDPALLTEARSLIHHEAALLDQRRFMEWLDLYTSDSTYWIPRQRNQTDPIAVPSIIYDDHPLMAMRVKRLMHPRAYSAMPTPHTLHVVGNVEITGHGEDQDIYRVTSSQIVIEAKENLQRVFAGSYEHVLRRTSSGLRIESKRIDLVDSDSIKDVMVILL